MNKENKDGKYFAIAVIAVCVLVGLVVGMGIRAAIDAIFFDDRDRATIVIPAAVVPVQIGSRGDREGSVTIVGGDYVKGDDVGGGKTVINMAKDDDDDR